LLYGIAKNSPLGFVHAASELRLGAIVEHAGEQQEIQRAKANKNTLRTAADQVLPGSVMERYLGAADRAFFEQMFGLDHSRLVHGGSSMLSAQSDVGQILFESASGVVNLGRIRGALKDEAETLWGPRKAKDRAFYSAQAEFEAATAGLKAAIARPKEWAEARKDVERQEKLLADAQSAHVALDKLRVVYERIRRVAPHVALLRAKSEALRQLGDVPSLPEDAERRLQAAEALIGKAEVLLREHEAMGARAAQERATLSYDDKILQHESDILDLSALRVQFRAHAGDILARQAEGALQWKVACRAATELGWQASSEEALALRLPSVMVRKSLQRLLRSHGAVTESLSAARKSERDKERELLHLKAELQKRAATEPSFALKSAISGAQRLGDSAATVRSLEHALAARRRQQEHAQLALGAFCPPVEELRAMVPPARDVVQRFLREHTEDEAELRALAKRLSALRRQRASQELDLAQYEATHDVVASEQVVAAREQRDQLWSSIKSDGAALQAQAPTYERHVDQADTLADRREGNLKEVTELRSKKNELARLSSDLEADAGEEARLVAQSSQRAARFAALAQECGLGAMTFDAALGWMDGREAVLGASESVGSAELELLDWQKRVSEAASALSSALLDTDEQFEPTDRLELLLARATAYVQRLDAARGEQLALSKQQSEAQRALTGLGEQRLQAETALKSWQSEWERAVTEAGILSSPDVASAEGALELFGQIDQALREMHELRSKRIHPMQADLAQLAERAAGLGQLLLGERAGLPAAEIESILSQRLKQAKESRDTSLRLARDEQEAKERADIQRREIELQGAVLQPLFDRAKVTSRVELSHVIAQSDEQRRLRQAIDQAQRGLVDGGDGLSQEHLEQEVDAADLTTLSAEVNANTARMNELVQLQPQLAADLSRARAHKEKFAGAADAAQWEGRRQEALAKMSDAIERYIKVATASELLKWSIERYRDTKQGPVLARAASIFARLTLGSFQSLTIDADKEPPILLGKRASGEVVSVDHMSDGTRDQLYLALRLAALDLHLGRAHALPFIADDLVINYDDARSRAALEALGDLSTKTQVLFLTHHDHLLPLIRDVFGPQVNIVHL
jgi:uncharacterized protein YhaN